MYTYQSYFSSRGVLCVHVYIHGCKRRIYIHTYIHTYIHRGVLHAEVLQEKAYVFLRILVLLLLGI